MGKFLSLSVDNTYLRLLRTFVLSIFLKGCVVNDMKANENSPHKKNSQTDIKTPHKGKPNHLINEKSPYLLQHAYNPVSMGGSGVSEGSQGRQTHLPFHRLFNVSLVSCYGIRIIRG